MGQYCVSYKHESVRQLEFFPFIIKCTFLGSSDSVSFTYFLQVYELNGIRKCRILTSLVKMKESQNML